MKIIRGKKQIALICNVSEILSLRTGLGMTNTNARNARIQPLDKLCRELEEKEAKK